MEFPNVISEKISHYLRERGETISIAESVTSGFLQLAFSQMECAEQFYNGGLTTYTIGEKIKHLNIDPVEAKACNCVSQNITKTMALNVANMFETNWSIATTGFATPVPESDHQIYAYFAIAYHGKIILSERIELHPLTDPLAAQHYYMEYVLGCLRCEVKKNVEDLAINH